MALHFSCVFDISNRHELLGIAAKLGEEFAFSGFQADEDTYFLEICPGANLEMNFSEDRLEFYCQGTPAGPGAHARAADFVDEFAKISGLAGAFEDETGYCAHRDYKKLRAAYDDWLLGVIAYAKEALQKDASGLVSVGWDPNWYYPQPQPGKILTLLGWLEPDKLEKRIKTGGISGVARDFFIWYNRQQDGWLYRNLALFHLWKDCYFMPSARSSQDEQVNGYIIKLLEEAAGQDDIPFPKHSYRELCALARHSPLPDSTLEKGPDYESGSALGFRRGIITHYFGNQGLGLPGNFLEGQGDHGKASMFYDSLPENWHGVTVWPNPVEGLVQNFDQDYFSESAEEPEVFEIEGARCCVAFMGQRTEGSNSYYTVKAEVISVYQVNFFSISFNRLEEKDWAFSLIRNLKVRDFSAKPDVTN